MNVNEKEIKELAEEIISSANSYYTISNGELNVPRILEDIVLSAVRIINITRNERWQRDVLQKILQVLI